MCAVPARSSARVVSRSRERNYALKIEDIYKNIILIYRQDLAETVH
jgi:hypothetical protein